MNYIDLAASLCTTGPVQLGYTGWGLKKKVKNGGTRMPGI